MQLDADSLKDTIFKKADSSSVEKEKYIKEDIEDDDDVDLSNFHVIDDIVDDSDEFITDALEDQGDYLYENCY